MKITCGSCGAKYTVSDEKVQGKTVKVKCRKCSAVIVVSSTGEVQTTGGNAPDGAAGGEAAFTVSVSDTDQRNMTMSEVVSAYNEGVIDAETYVWAEGMDDWQAVKDVDGIVDALHEAAEAPSSVGAAELSSTVAMDAGSGPYSQPPAAYSQPPASYSQPPASSGYGAQAPSNGGFNAPSQPPAATASDMFGGAPAAVSSSPFDVSGGASGGGSFGGSGGGDAGFFGGGAASSASSLGSSSTEENSAIFSLNMLTAKVEGDSPSTSSGGGTTEDSGLIDLKALAAGMGGDSEGVAAVATGPATDGVFPLGAPAPIAAPVVSASIPAQQQSTSRGLVVGLGAAVAVLAAALIFFIVKDSGETTSGSEASGTKTSAPVDTGSPLGAPPTPTPVATPTPSSTASSDVVADASASADASGKPVAVGPRPVGPRPVGGPRPPTGPKPPTPKTKKKGTSGGGAKGPCGCPQSDLMCHMRCSNKKKKKKK